MGSLTDAARDSTRRGCDDAARDSTRRHTPGFLIRLMQHRPLADGSSLGPEDGAAYKFAQDLRVATMQQRLRAVWTHPANELASVDKTMPRRFMVRAAIARALGLITGTSDFLFLWDAGSMAIELKSADGRLTAHQRDFRDWCALTGVPFHVVRSSAEGLALLRDAGVLA